MSQQKVYEILKELGGEATIKEIGKEQRKNTQMIVYILIQVCV